MTIAKAIARAWSDTEFKQKLLSNPSAALAENGIEIAAGTTVKVVENTADTRHIVLPLAPKNADELSQNDLEEIAGGGSPAYFTATIDDV